ncbi:MAG: psaA [Gammaproteobacteria bacterium]|jgi:zinc/manganese transport system substrate-binding protein|nr:psaA [Gammaproteobacteria bacterium]
MGQKIKVFLYIALCLYAYSLCTKGFCANTFVIQVAAAENIYGEIAKELGGPYVDVTNIINNPNQDPHLFTTSPGTARALAKAHIIIYNGADYDSWMNSLLVIQGQKNRNTIVIAELMGIKKGENPHIWYKPETIPRFAQALVRLYIQLDPQHVAYYQKQLEIFHQKYQIIFKIIQQMKQKFKNTPVIATEPVFNYMAESLGLVMYGQDFQLSMMNDIPPTISQIKEFQKKLYQHAVRLIIFNKQVINPAVRQMLMIANKQKIPSVGVSEMLPSHATYIQWMISQLTDLRRSLRQ